MVEVAEKIQGKKLGGGGGLLFCTRELATIFDYIGLDEQPGIERWHRHVISVPAVVDVRSGQAIAETVREIDLQLQTRNLHSPVILTLQEDSSDIAS